MIHYDLYLIIILNVLIIIELNNKFVIINLLQIDFFMIDKLRNSIFLKIRKIFIDKINWLIELYIALPNVIYIINRLIVYI